MKMKELHDAYLTGKIEKKLYFALMRENYLHIIPEIQQLLIENAECSEIQITKDACVLKRTDGVKLYFDFTQAICRAEADLIIDGDPELEDMRYINEYLNGKNGTVLDIGGNVGMFSIYLYKKHRDLNYYIFEPIPSTFGMLEKTLELNEVNNNFHIFNIGMSDIIGESTFFVPSANEGASLVANNDEFYRKKSDSLGRYTGDTDLDQVSGMLETVDSFVQRNTIQDVCFVKIDVEGNEKNVLKGAKNTLLTFRPLVYCELLRKHAKRFGYHPNDVIHFMRDLGYGCSTMREGVLTDIEEIDEDTVETNFFFHCQ